ncbi:MAG: methyltransferase domain-containing protein [Gemmatimonadetes bacterium]|nr:methyltransferase domain-containing protein [Gemmatimonadota bacterium]
MLDLVRLSPKTLFPPGGKELYRHIALLTELSPGDEVLVAACGQGISLEYFVEEFDVVGSGVDFDAEMIEVAEGRAKAAGRSDRLHFQAAPLGDLPYRDGVFTVSIGELGLTARADPETAVRELVRVAKPGGEVVLIQLVWTAPVEEDRRDILIEHLGTRPLMLVEWKKLLRECGVVGLHVEDWSDQETTFRPHVKLPFRDFGELFTAWERLAILRRAWGRWGWRGVRDALAREEEVHRLLTRERLLGLTLIKGSKWQEPRGDGSGGPAE